MAAASSMNNLTTLIKRLEAATSRLEDIATTVDGSHTETAAAASAPHAAAAAVVPSLPAIAEAPAEPLPRSVEAFDELIEADVAAFVAASSKLGGLVEEQAKAVQQAFHAERSYLLVTTKAKKPADDQPPELLTELHRYISTVDDIRVGNRASPLFTHLSAVGEGIVALGWIAEKRPADFVNDVLGGAQYYGNKILKEYKDKDQTHVEYIQAYYKVFRSLIAYVKEFFATGLTWNNKDGIDALEALKQVQSGSVTPKASGAPAPPPPPPPPVFDNAGGPPAPPPPPSATVAKGGDMSSVFDQLNQGSAVTSGLRKVDKSEMTHKNPSLRAGAVVPERTSSQSSATSVNGRGKSPLPNKKPETMRTKKAGRKELDGNKWIVENFDNTGSEVVRITAENSQSILISRCTKCIIQVKGKANAISIDNCTSLSIIVESLVSSLDVIKSPKFRVQIDGVVPTILFDQVDDAQIYLGQQSLGTEVYSSKSSGINIVLPSMSDVEWEDDSKECAVPEQLRSYVKDGALVTEVVKHAG